MAFRFVRTAAAAAAVAVMLVGCSPSPSPSPTDTAIPSTSPTATASAPATAAPRDATAALEAIDAYALCRAQTTGYYEGDFAKVHFAPFADATVLLRDDGLWFAYIEVDDENREPALVEVAASHCAVGGTIGEPEWALFGTMTRDGAADLIANFNGPLPSD